jgi:hypothetical protein
MGEIVNLRRARKARARDDAAQAAAENRALHGQTRAQRDASLLETLRDARRHEGNRLKNDE